MQSTGGSRAARCAAGLAALLVAHSSAAGPTARVIALRAGERSDAGTAFFVRASGAAGAAAVGTAHSLPVAELAALERVEFELGAGAQPVSSSALLAPPGRPYADSGGIFAEDFHLYALDGAPQTGELLELAAGERLRVGLEVEILGPPPRGPEASAASARLAGRIAAATPLRVEIDLEGRHELAGWGGAPVVRAGTSRVIGVLQAVRSQARGTTLVAAPIARLAEALRRPLRGGRGQPFAELAAALPKPGAERELLRQEPEQPGLSLTLEYPPDASAVADSGCGVFVAGRAAPAALRRYDVVFALDVSSSTREPSGADIDGDGIVGAPSAGPLSALRGALEADPGDSVAAAEIAAARALLARLDPRSVRVGLVSFSGFDASSAGGVWQDLTGTLGGARLHAETLAPLTRDYASIERALERLLERTPNGHTHIGAGLDQAVGELAGVRGARSKGDASSQKLVFLFTDGEPTLPYPGHPAANTRVVLEAAERARSAGITVHTFAVGPEALAGPIATVELAARTGGVFTPVRAPGDLALAVGMLELPRLSALELSSGAGAAPARILRMSADGIWAGFVPLEDGGEQQLRIHAIANDGSEVSRSVRVRRGSAEQAAEIPAALAARRNELLEECLELVRAEADAAERLRAEQLRERLREEILRERLRAKQRAQEQRRELELEVEAP